MTLFRQCGDCSPWLSPVSLTQSPAPTVSAAVVTDWEVSRISSQKLPRSRVGSQQWSWSFQRSTSSQPNTSFACKRKRKQNSFKKKIQMHLICSGESALKLLTPTPYRLYLLLAGETLAPWNRRCTGFLHRAAERSSCRLGAPATWVRSRPSPL